MLHLELPLREAALPALTDGLSHVSRATCPVLMPASQQSAWTDFLTLSPPNWLQEANQTCNSQKMDLPDCACALLALQLTKRFRSLYTSILCVKLPEMRRGNLWSSMVTEDRAQKHPSCDKTLPGMDCGYSIESSLIWSSAFFSDMRNLHETREKD